MISPPKFSSSTLLLYSFNVGYLAMTLVQRHQLFSTIVKDTRSILVFRLCRHFKLAVMQCLSTYPWRFFTHNSLVSFLEVILRAFTVTPFSLICSPSQLCKIMQGQSYSKKLNEKQVTARLRTTCHRPHDREQSINKVCMFSSRPYFQFSEL